MQQAHESQGLVIDRLRHHKLTLPNRGQFKPGQGQTNGSRTYRAPIHQGEWLVNSFPMPWIRKRTSSRWSARFSSALFTDVTVSPDNESSAGSTASSCCFTFDQPGFTEKVASMKSRT